MYSIPFCRHEKIIPGKDIVDGIIPIYNMMLILYLTRLTDLNDHRRRRHLLNNNFLIQC